MSPFRLGVFIALFSLIPFAALSHEGHSHGDEAPPTNVVSAPRATATSALFEVVAVADGPDLTIYVDRFDTNEPVTGGTVLVETPAGPATAKVTGDSYELEAPWATEPGDHELLFTIEAGVDIDFLPATLSIPNTTLPQTQTPGFGSVPMADGATRAEAVKMAALGATGFLLGLAVMTLRRRRLLAAGLATVVLALAVTTTVALADMPAPVIRDVAQRLPDGRIFAPKAAQRILAIRTLSAVETEHRRSIEMAGRVVPDPNASGFVQTAIGGRLAPPPGGFPQPGSEVRAGQIMALVEPSLAAAEQSSIRQTKAELDQEIALEERQIARFTPLAATGAIPKARLEEAELTLQGLRDRRAALDALPMAAEPLVAPVAGIVSKANAAPGLIAETNTEVFHIIDPKKLWVEASLFADAEIAGAASVTAADGQPVALSLIGLGFAEDGQAQPVHFRITNPAGNLKVGARVTVYAETKEVRTGIALPREAVVRGANGEDMIFVHIGPELFEPRPVRTASLDGGRVLVAAGVAAGERVVTQGAELLNQLR